MSNEQSNVGEPPRDDTPEVVDTLFEKLNNADVGKADLSRQEENWLLMTLLQMPWHHANKVEDPVDRKFLLGRAEQIKVMAIAQQEEQMRMMQQQQEQEQGGESGSSILTPQDFMPPR